MVSKATVQETKIKQSKITVKVTVQKAIPELWSDISNKMIKYQLSHIRFDQIGDHEHDLYLYRMLSRQQINTNKK